jgi:hypothetical protein
MKYLSLIGKMRKLERSSATLKAKLKDQKKKETAAAASHEVRECLCKTTALLGWCKKKILR